jgi:glycosyltransferase involved in cell wall biosynthesis
LVTSNGIDPAEFGPPDPPRNPLQVVYGSDYVRGLRALLESWPTIRRAVPGARLNIFYGWESLEHHNPERATALKREFAPLMTAAGVTHLGRLSHSTVTAQYRQAGIWAYPCSFREVSCISAMKAQAGGAVPVVVPNGALRETVRWGFRTSQNFDEVSDPAAGRAIVREWREGLINLLRSPERQDRTRLEMVPWSKDAFAWSKVADRWEGEFSSALAGRT